MTVAHPFFEPAASLGYDSSSSSLPSNDSGQDEDFESDSQDDGEGEMHTRPSLSHSPFRIYLEDFESPKQNQSFSDSGFLLSPGVNKCLVGYRDLYRGSIFCLEILVFRAGLGPFGNK